MFTHTFLWMLSGSAITLAALWFWNSLARYTAHIAEEAPLFLQPIPWHEAESAVNSGNFYDTYQTELQSYTTSRDRELRRDLLTRIVLNRVIFRRMDENSETIRLAVDHDRRVALRWGKDVIQESIENLSAATALRQAAESLLRDAELPENQSEANEFKRQTAVLLADANALLAEDAEHRQEFETHIKNISAARNATEEFHQRVRRQLLKLTLLVVLLRFDKLRLLPVGLIAAVWEAGIHDVLFLYKEAKEKAVAHAAYYSLHTEVLTRM